MSVKFEVGMVGNQNHFRSIEKEHKFEKLQMYVRT